MANGTNGARHGPFGSTGGMAIIAGGGVVLGVMVTFLTATLYLGGTFERLNSLNIRYDTLQHRVDQIDQSGNLRQIEINTQRLNQIETAGSPQIATMRETLSNTLLRLQHLEGVVAVLPDTDAKIKEDFATMRADVMQARRGVDSIEKNFRPREFWEKLAGSIATIDAQIHDLMDTRSSGVLQWGMIVSRVGALEAKATSFEENIKSLRDRVNQHNADDAVGLRDRLSAAQHDAVSNQQQDELIRTLRELRPLPAQVAPVVPVAPVAPVLPVAPLVPERR